MKMSKLRITAIGFFIALIIMQFIRPVRNNNGQVTDNHIEKINPMNLEVKKVLGQSCYDCHSNNTQYPFYANIEPIGWLLNNHINNAKKQLNFSEFGTYSNRKQRNKLTAIKNSIKDNKMPLSSYTLIHRNAILTDNQKTEIYNWVDSTLTKY